MDTTQDLVRIPPSLVMQRANELVGQNCDWVTFYREIFGVGGAVRRLFPTRPLLVEFQQTNDHARLVAALQQLLREDRDPDPAHEPTRIVTVRLPKSLHESLKREGHEAQTSMNRLCIAKLVAPVGGVHFQAPART